MQSDKYLIRRAVIDDLPTLAPLWSGMHYSPAELERRLTDFQVAVDGQGRLLGCVAFEVAGQQGRIHHEAFEDFSVAEQLRPLFWERLQMIASSNLVFRVWTQENAPFWKQILRPAEKGDLQKLPAKWVNDQGGWLMLQLKEEAAIRALTDTGDVDLLLKTEREKTERTLEQAKMLKNLAMIAAIILAAAVGILILYALKRDPGIIQQFQQIPK